MEDKIADNGEKWPTSNLVGPRFLNVLGTILFSSPRKPLE